MNRFVAILAFVGFLLANAVPLSGLKSLSAKNVGAAAAMQSLPLTFVPGNENLLWTFDLKVGSQQKFNLTLDINGGESFLFLKRLRVEDPEECGSDNGARRFFDTSLSDTYESNIAGFDGGMDRYPYLSLACRAKFPNFPLIGIEAWYSTDTFNFGALSAPETPFVVVQEVRWPLNPQWPSDGTFGLNDYSQKLSTTSKILSGFDKQEITLFLKSDPNSGGQITFGGKDTKNCGNKWTTFKRRHNEDWAAYVPNLTLYSKVIDFGWNVSLATKRPFLALPFDTFEPIVRTLRAEYDFATDLYTKTSSGLKCALLVTGDMGGPKLGSQFLPPGCIHLDYTNDAVSFEAGL